MRPINNIHFEQARSRMTLGMTLIEVLIAMTILAFLSVFTAQAIQSALQARNRIQSELDRSVELREALNVISRDIQLAFNYRDVNIQLFNAAQEARKKKAQAGDQGGGGQQGDGQGGGGGASDVGVNQQQQQQNFELKEEIIVTQFLGTENTLDFTTTSRIRSQKNAAFSDQQKVGYRVASCRRRLDPSQSSNCLWRRTSPFLDNDVTQGGVESVLLEGVQDFELRYLGPGHEENWINVWRSDGSQEAVMQDRFPYAVEVSLSIEDTRRDPPRTLAMTIVAPIRFSNNLAEEPPDTGEPLAP